MCQAMNETLLKLDVCLITRESINRH